MASETLSRTNLLELPMLALIIFIALFAFVVARVLMRGKRDPEYVALAHLPLEEDANTSSSKETGHED